MTNSLSKGLHFRQIKNKIGFWPWCSQKSRLIETLFARMRIGHINVGEWMCRFGKAPTDRCHCGQIENIRHILVECRLYHAQRQTMIRKFNCINVGFDFKNLLGGGDFPLESQNKIISIVTTYLKNIGKLRRL